ncbi:MAG: DUF2062 domain-containing protein [Pseudomonadota bacterium]
MESLRALFAPRRGWRRVFEYYRHRMKRLPDSPSRIALGFACGVYTSFTPFFGFHFVVAAAFAWLLRGNVLASAIGTFIGNPLTFPFIVAICLEIGSLIMGAPIDADFEGLDVIEIAILLLQNIHELVVPYFVGGIVPGMASAIASFFLIRPLVKQYQQRRRARLMARARMRIEAQSALPPSGAEGQAAE